MRSTGVVRRIDDLGRIVIPKEIRRTMRLREGDAMEIFVEGGGEIVLKKYSMMTGLSDFSEKYADALAKFSGLVCAVCDTDRIVSISGRKEGIGAPITREIEEVLYKRMPYYRQFISEKNVYPFMNAMIAVVGAVPIITNGDCAGAVMLLSEDGLTMTDSQKKLLTLTASLMSKNMEE